MPYAVSVLAFVAAMWCSWLIFVYFFIRAHGLEAVKSLPVIAKAFPLTAWVIRRALPFDDVGLLPQIDHLPDERRR